MLRMADNLGQHLAIGKADYLLPSRREKYADLSRLKESRKRQYKLTLDNHSETANPLNSRLSSAGGFARRVCAWSRRVPSCVNAGSSASPPHTRPARCIP